VTTRVAGEGYEVKISLIRHTELLGSPMESRIVPVSTGGMGYVLFFYWATGLPFYTFFEEHMSQQRNKGSANKKCAESPAESCT
jgi:hypothetical protein